MATLTFEPLTGARLSAALPDLARLRMAVFGEWPYLYDGDLAYETRYLEAYATSPGALVVGAFDGARLVGAATAAPMEDHAEAFAAPFRQQGQALSDILYCGESVLLPAWRGRGAGRAFFAAREAHGRALGRRLSCFCAVKRDEGDPRRPAGYQPLDAFWRRLGYAPLPDATVSFAWREIGGAGEVDHAMTVWVKPIG